MNLYDKLAVSLLVMCGMFVGQIEAAMPGAFSRVVEPEGGRCAADISETPPFQVQVEFFLMVETFSYSYATNGNLLTKGTSATLTYGGSRPHAVTSATAKGFARSYSYDAAGYVVSDGKRTYLWTSFGQLLQLDYAAAPELKDFSENLVHPEGRVFSEFDFDSGGNRARQTKERTAANDSRAIEQTLHLGSYEREIHSTITG